MDDEAEDEDEEAWEEGAEDIIDNKASFRGPDAKDIEGKRRLEQIWKLVYLPWWHKVYLPWWHKATNSICLPKIWKKKFTLWLKSCVLKMEILSFAC